MRQIFIWILTIVTATCCAQTSSDKVLYFDNEDLLRFKVFGNVYQCDISPFSDGENPVFSDERDFKTKTTLFSDYGKEIELPNESDKYRLEIYAKSIEVNNKFNIIEITGFISGGWYGAGSHVHVYIGQKVDTLVNITLGPNLHGPIYYNGKKVNKPIVIDTLPAFKFSNYIHQKSEVGFDDHKKRAFKISGQIDNNSVLVFGLSSSYVEIFEIGRFLRDAKFK